MWEVKYFALCVLVSERCWYAVTHAKVQLAQITVNEVDVIKVPGSQFSKMIGHARLPNAYSSATPIVDIYTGIASFQGQH